MTTSTISSDDLANLFSRGCYSQIIDIFRADTNTSSIDPYSAQFLAAANFKLGNFSEAYNILLEHESALGESSDYLSLYGATCRRLGMIDAAHDLLEKALSLDPDSHSVINNYANVLIDMGRLDKAKSMLLGVLDKNPNYIDAQSNLNRIIFLETQSSPPAASNPTTQGISNTESDPMALNFDLSNPLLLAFTDEEVKHYGRLSGKSHSDESSRKITLEKLRLAEVAVKEKNFSLALTLCSDIYLISDPLPAIYDCVADALIGLKKFQSAELFILHAILISEPTFKQYINLTALSSMRGDVKLASLYLEKASCIEPNHPHLQTVHSNLEKRRQQVSQFKFSV